MDNNALPIIQSYGNGGFTVNITRYDGSLALHAGGITLWPVLQLSLATNADFDWAIKLSPNIEFLVIGSGKLFLPLSSGIRSHFRTNAISVDVMDTGAACRTYNVLANEGRRVAAALVAL